MGFPDRIERTVRVDRPVERVWAAITTAEGLGAWFSDSAEIDLRVGGTAKLTWDSGDAAQLRVERLEPMTVFGYTWGINGLPDHDPRRTYVEFTLTPDDGGTTVSVVETGFAQLEPDDYRKAFDSNTRGWAAELDELVAYLHG
ncbi:SRPBCC family protein [Micromonospora coerulea]|uniref:SRPBCC family protein n=1 Tax=Micromonospora coerulea TaxID=47856 RepID=A0ABP8S602_9ACTN|nr:SRPBCC domain-containing protein [Micromonospora veneta]